MRLLKVVQPGEYILVQVPTHDTHPYAILSHTWVDGQEVNYQELITGTGKSKVGYEKIKFCAEQATRDGLHYFWVDTCCIDKSDPNELSTAINSMFRWYRNAKKCYVYLADVTTYGYGADIQTNPSIWDAAFRGSKWFTRGWTLQELIAPKIVEFYSKEAKLLGDKASLEKPVHEITQIPIQALQGNPFSDFSIDERKGWAVQRQTTIEEDIVYCLLGLCEVSMPPIYGEGKEAALKRLEMTVRGFSKESSAPKNLEDNFIPFIVPFNRNCHFTGRADQLADLERRLFIGEQTSKIAITGLGGVGKTQLVLELAYRTRAKYQNCSVLWIPATDIESLQHAYVDVAQQLNITGWDDKSADVKKLVQLYLSKTVGRWLLIFDNADNVDMWIGQSMSEPGSGRLIDSLPRSTRGCVVFTTRDRKTAVKLAQQNVVHVPEMSEDVATQLVRKCLVNQDLVNHEQDTKALLKELTFLPLAIVQATAYVNENGITFADYLSLLADQEEEAIDLLSEEFEDEGRYQNIKNPVATTWLISFEQIRLRDSLAADYLSFMACIEPKDIPQSVLPAGTSRKKEIEAIGTLEAYSFIIKRPADLAFDLHRLVHLAMRNWLRKEELITQWTERAVTRLEEVFPDDDHQNRSLWRTYLPHVHHVLGSNLVDKDWEIRTSLVWRYGMCLYEDGRWNDAGAAIAEVLEAERRDLGQEHPSTLSSISNLALTLSNRGRWKEAGDLEEQVLETSLRVLGQDHPDTLITMDNLASTYRDQGRWREAKDLEVQVMKTKLRVLGQEHPSTLTSMTNLASTYREQGRWKEAEDLEEQVLETSLRVLEQEHPSTLTSMTNLASTYREQGRWKEAEDLEVQVMKTKLRVLGQEHPSTLTSMTNLASTYREQGRWKEAEDLEVQVLETSLRVLGQEHPDTLTSMTNLAVTYSIQGRWKEAEDLEVQVMETKLRVLGQKHPSTLTSMTNLAVTYSNQGRWKEAEDLEEQVLEISLRVLGQEHPSTLTSMTHLAVTYSNQRRWKEAEDLEVQVMETKLRVLGQEHRSTLTSMTNLAVTYSNQGRWKEAEDLEEQVLETSLRVLGQEHPDTLNCMANLASTYRRQERWKEAEELQTKEIEISSRVLGQEHPGTLSSMSNLASIWKGVGRDADALELLKQCVELRARVLGSNHPDTLSSSITLLAWEAEELEVSSSANRE